MRVTTPEGDTLCINPVYHGNFLDKTSILAYEPDLRKVLEQFVRPGMAVYDVGANVGVFSLFALNRITESGHLYAFDPEKNNLRYLLETRASNHYSNFTVEQVGVGDKTETLFFDRRGGAMSGRIIKSAGSDENTIAMDVVSLDDYVYARNNRPPDLLKIDVEGHEVKVIDGMKKILRDYAPIIVCELHHALEPAVVNIHATLAEFGYVSHDVADWINNPDKNKAGLTGFQGIHHFIAFKEAG